MASACSHQHRVGASVQMQACASLASLNHKSLCDPSAQVATHPKAKQHTVQARMDARE
jgi:hypothetical protein